MDAAGATLSAAEKKTIEFGLVRVGGWEIGRVNKKNGENQRVYQEVVHTSTQRLFTAVRGESAPQHMYKPPCWRYFVSISRS